MKAIIKSVSEARAWNNPKGGTLYYRNYTLDNGETINLGSQNEIPSWGEVGKEIEYEVSGQDAKGNPKHKRITPQKGNFVAKKMSYEDVQTYAKMNAIRACSIVDDKYEERTLLTDDYQNVKLVARFILGDIRSEIDLWGAERTKLDLRRDAVLSAAEATKVFRYKSANALISVAESHFEFVA